MGGAVNTAWLARGKGRRHGRREFRPALWTFRPLNPGFEKKPRNNVRGLSGEGSAAMNQHTVKGKAENLKGRAKQAAGAMTGRKDVEAKGLADRMKGAARGAAGKVKDKLDKAAVRTRAHESSAERRTREREEALDEPRTHSSRHGHA
jgi:uncharacterized protein YjbJ (UPF0337 family)